MSRLRGVEGARGHGGLRTALLVLLALVAGWSGTATAAAAPTAARIGAVVTTGQAQAQPGAGRGVRTAERAIGSQVATAISAANTQLDRRLPGPVPALPASVFVPAPPVAVGGRTTNAPPQAPVPTSPAAFHGRAPPLLVGPPPNPDQ